MGAHFKYVPSFDRSIRCFIIAKKPYEEASNGVLTRQNTWDEGNEILLGGQINLDSI